MAVPFHGSECSLVADELSISDVSLRDNLDLPVPWAEFSSGGIVPEPVSWSSEFLYGPSWYGIPNKGNDAGLPDGG